MIGKKNYSKFKAILLLLLIFTTTNVLAQDEDGPAPPPPTAPINKWIPISIIIGVALGGYTLMKNKKV